MKEKRKKKVERKKFEKKKVIQAHKMDKKMSLEDRMRLNA